MIRFATVDDLERIVEIYNQAVAHSFATADTEPIELTERVAWFTDHDQFNFPIYVIEQDGPVVGWCSLNPYRGRRAALLGTAEIAYYLDYDYHGQGIGSALVKHVLDDCPRLGKHSLFAILLEPNVGSVALLQKFGFEQWGRLPNVARIDGKPYSQLILGKSVG